MRCELSLISLALCAVQAAAPVNIDYKSLKTSKGDGIPDFSFAGYYASNKDLPSAKQAATDTLTATSGDQSKRIQEALDKIGSSGGGILALGAGKFDLSTGLVIPNGTVLRGAGPSKTTLTTKDGLAKVITMGEKVTSPTQGKAIAITDKYVPTGASKVNVENATGLKVGQKVWIQRAVTAKWVRANGMADIVDPKTDEHEPWIKPGELVNQPRTISSISGNAITLDIPLTDTLDTTYMKPFLVPYTPPTAPTDLGLESLAITLSPSCSGAIVNGATCKGSALSILPWTTNAYARSLSLTGFNNAINIAQNASQITLQSLSIHRDGATDNSGGYAADIGISGQQVLVADCGTKGPAEAKSFPVVTQGLTPGPNAVVRYFAQQPVMQIQPHAHWAHGFLVDNSSVATGLINRGSAGTGHGWAINAGVAWNVVGGWQVQSPPTGVNWGVGLRGDEVKPKENNGSLEAVGEVVLPASLFETQLKARGK